MKITKKVTSIVLALMLVISAFAGLAVTAGAASYPSGVLSTTYPDQSDVSLTIHKGDIDQGTDGAAALINTTSNLTGSTADKPVNFKALTGQSVTFTVYYVGNINTPEPTTANVDDYKKIAEIETSTTTGEATFSLSGTEGYNWSEVTGDRRGLYYVVETKSPDKVTTKAAPFFVHLPMTAQNDTTTTSNNGTMWLANIHAYPKNLTTLGGAVLTKTINNTAPSAAGTVATYPQFTLFEQIGTKDGETITDDVAIATITIGSAYTPVTLNESLSDEKKARYATVVIAQKDGVIAVDGLPAAFGSDGTPTAASYYFKETQATKIGEETLPLASDFDFSVAPGQNIDVVTTEADFAKITSTTEASTAAWQAKKDNSARPTIEKDVLDATGVERDLDGGSFTIGKDVVWVIKPSIPSDMDSLKKYTVEDEIDSRLDCVGVNAVAVEVTGATLVKDTDYTIKFAAATQDTKAKVTVDFTPSGRTKLAGTGVSDLKIKITTQINDTAVADAHIENQAKLLFTNQYDTEDEAESDKPFVYTGAFLIEKQDSAAATTKLAKVEFTLATADGRAIYVKPVADTAVPPSGTNYYVVCAQSDGGATNTVVTGTNGQFYVNGLQYGADAYKLTETKTNNGYQLLSTPVNITVSDSSDTTAFVIKNAKTPDLPLTGGMGTILFTVAGLVLIGGAAFFFIRSRKSSKEEA